MAPTDELEYLKSLVNQLNEKIKSLEEKAKNKAGGSGGEEKKGSPLPGGLRMILMGPPGAGTLSIKLLQLSKTQTDCLLIHSQIPVSNR